MDAIVALIGQFPLSEVHGNYIGPSWYVRVSTKMGIPQQGPFQGCFKNQPSTSVGVCIRKWPSRVIGQKLWLTLAD